MKNRYRNEVSGEMMKRRQRSVDVPKTYENNIRSPLSCQSANWSSGGRNCWRKPMKIMESTRLKKIVGETSL